MKIGKYSLKTYTNNIYSWTPERNRFKKKLKQNQIAVTFYCTATPFSQGEDWVTSYVYKKTIKGNQEHREAYVACDYVN